MWILCALFYGYQYFLQVSPSVMVHDLMRSFNINAVLLGNLAASYFYAYALMQVPVGLILDRFGARFPLTIAAFLCAAGCFLFGGSGFFAITTFGRLLIGVGSAFAVIGSMYLASLWLNPKRFALFNGILTAIGMLGAVCGQTPLALLVDAINWRNATMILGVIGIIFAIFMWLVIRDKHRIVVHEATPIVNIWRGLKHVLINKQIWLLAIYGVLMFMPTSVLGSLWGVPFLMRKYHINNAVAGGIITFLFLGWAVGCPFFGWLSDQLRKRNIVMLIANIGALISIIFMLYVPATLPYSLNMLFLFSFGFFSSGFIIAYAAVKENNTTKNIATALGFMNMVNMTGGAVFQPLVGWFLDLQWRGLMEHGVRLYSVASYQLALTVIPLGMLISLLVLLFIRETHCQRRV